MIKDYEYLDPLIINKQELIGLEGKGDKEWQTYFDNHPDIIPLLKSNQVIVKEYITELKLPYGVAYPLHRLCLI